MSVVGVAEEGELVEEDGLCWTGPGAAPCSSQATATSLSRGRAALSVLQLLPHAGLPAAMPGGTGDGGGGDGGAGGGGGGARDLLVCCRAACGGRFGGRCLFRGEMNRRFQAVLVVAAVLLLLLLWRVAEKSSNVCSSSGGFCCYCCCCGGGGYSNPRLVTVH